MTRIADLANLSPEEHERQLLESAATYAERMERARRAAKRKLDAEERGHVPPLKFYTEADLDRLPAARWLVHGLILESSFGMLVAPPATGKTALALSLSLAIAAGHVSWLGRKVSRHGPVVYVAAEGKSRFKYRKNVWRQVHNVRGELPFHSVLEPLDLRDDARMAEFLDVVKDWQPVLIVFDTLNRCLPGAEENSAKEFGEAIAACTRLQQGTGASVLLLHHPRKDGASARGSSAVLGAVDTELWLARGADKNLVTLTCGKQKEGDDDLTITLKRRVVELAHTFEADGSPVTSIVFDVATDADLTKSATSLEVRILDYIHNHPGLSKNEVVSGLKLQRKAVLDAIKRLVTDGCLSETPGGRGNKSKLLHFVSYTPTNPFLTSQP